MQNKLELYCPVKPLFYNQHFGANPTYYAKFLDANGNPEKGHPGLDLHATHGVPVYAAHDGQAMWLSDSHGGEGIYLYTPTQFDYNGKPSYFITIYWHLIGDTDPGYPNLFTEKYVKRPVKTGDLIGYADNTGAPFESSGDHLHFGLVPCDVYGNISEPANGYGGAIDPEPYLNGFFAQDVASVDMLEQGMQEVTTEVKTNPQQAQEELGWLSKLLKALMGIFN